MKKIFLLSMSIVTLALTVMMSVSRPVCVMETDVEALAACEIQNKKGEIIFKCQGDEGECQDTYLGHTLTCSGKRVL